MNGSTTPLSRDRMEEMLADYAFGALPEAETQRFEQSLAQYPDIQSDIQHIREAFAQFDREDFLERQTRPARTLSVHVQERLAGRRTLFGSRSLRHVVPALAVALLAAFIFLPGGLFNSSGIPADVAVVEQPAPAEQPVESIAPADRSVAAEQPVAAVRPSAPSGVAAAVTARGAAQLVKDTRVSDPMQVVAALPDRTPMSDIDIVKELELVVDESLAISDEIAGQLADNALFPMSDYSLGGGLYDDLEELELQQLLEEFDDDIL